MIPQIFNRQYQRIGLMGLTSPEGVHFYDDELTTTIDTGMYTLKFKVPKTSPSVSVLDVGNFIWTENHVGEKLLLTITSIEENREVKSISCEDTSINLLNTYVEAFEAPVADQRLDYYMDATLEGTGWVVNKNESGDKVLRLEFSSPQRTLERIRSIAKSFGMELEFKTEFTPGQKPKMMVNVVKERKSDDNTFRVTSEDTLYNLHRKINTFDIYNRVIVRGREIQEPKQQPTASKPATPPKQQDDLVEKLVEVAMAQKGKPYVWGADGPYSFDCSGFCNYCYRKAGFTNYPNYRLTSQAVWAARDAGLSRVSSPERGDMVLMDTGYTWAGDANHIGIYLGNGQMIHAGSPVQVAKTANFKVLGYVRVKR